MRVTVIPDDKVILVDGVPLWFDYDCAPNVHAIQWDGETGAIEFKVGGAVPATINDVQPFVDAWMAEQERQDTEGDA